MSNALGPKKNYSQDSSSGNTFFSAKNRSESFFNDVKTNGQPNNIIQKKNNGISNNQPVQFFWGDAYKVLKSGVGGVNVLNILSGGSRVANALGPVGRAIPYFGLGTGIADMITGDNIFDQAAGAARAIGGGAGIAGSFGAIPTVASLANAPVIGAGALSAGGALGSAGAAATTVGGVLMAGAAGYGVGRGLDWGADKIGDLITGNEAEDHSISGLMAGAMHRGDRLFTSTMRGLGVYDENAPEYTQTIGWQLADMVDGISNGHLMSGIPFPEERPMHGTLFPEGHLMSGIPFPEERPMHGTLFPEGHLMPGIPFPGERPMHGTLFPEGHLMPGIPFPGERQTHGTLFPEGHLMHGIPFPGERPMHGTLFPEGHLMPGIPFPGERQTPGTLFPEGHLMHGTV